jgi:hypothetical protein
LGGYERNTEIRTFPSYVGTNTYEKKIDQYKYNIFSFVDEPWNRCCEVGSCGGCPDNEFVSKVVPKLDWL